MSFWQVHECTVPPHQAFARVPSFQAAFFLLSIWQSPIHFLTLSLLLFSENLPGHLLFVYFQHLFPNSCTSLLIKPQPFTS
jgi:hypothetical protein